MRTGGEEKMHSKVASCFHLKVPKLVNLTNRRGRKSEIITSSPCERKLHQDQEKISKALENQIKPKQKKRKLKSKQPVKTKRKSLSKSNVMLTKKDGLALFVKGFVCRM